MSAPAAAVRELVVDRFEGDYAVVEVDGDGTVDLPRWLLPRGISEGDLLRARVGEVEGVWRVEIEVDAGETEARRKAAEETVRRMSARDPGGDIQL